MMRQHSSRASEAGYSIVELALVVGIIGIMTALATPLFLTYYQASSLRVAAEEVAAFINQGRQLGIKENVVNPGVCVHITPTALQYRLGSCAAAAWVGPGTDAAGNVKVPDGITLTKNNDPIFSYLGAANPGATITVKNSQTEATLRVVVAASGRVCISAAATCVGP
jgi:Tfp pilus assembly protein FimT